MSDQAQKQIEGLQAQLVAAKEMHNEQLSNNHILRTNIILLQQENQRLDGNIKTLTQKVLELTPKPEPVEPLPESKL